jgi:hypothetical protein
MLHGTLQLAAESFALRKMNRLMALIPDPIERSNMIHANDDIIFRKIACDVAVPIVGSWLAFDIMARLIEITPDPIERSNMIHASDDAVFRRAVVFTNLKLINRLLELTPDPEQRLSMINASLLSAMDPVLNIDNLHVINRLIELVPDQEQRSNLIHNNYEAPFRRAAKLGRLDVMNRLVELTPDPIARSTMIRAWGNNPFANAIVGGHIDMMEMLVRFTPDPVQRSMMIHKGNTFLFTPRENNRFMLVKPKLQELTNLCLGTDQQISYLAAQGYEYSDLLEVFELSKAFREAEPSLRDEFPTVITNLILQYVASTDMTPSQVNLAILVKQIGPGPLALIPSTVNRSYLSEIDLFLFKMQYIVVIESILKEDSLGLAINSLERVVKLCNAHPELTEEDLRAAILASNKETSFLTILYNTESLLTISKAVGNSYNKDLVKDSTLRTFKAYYNERAGVVDVIEELTKQTMSELMLNPAYQKIPLRLIEKMTYDMLVSAGLAKKVDDFLRVNAPAKGIKHFTHGIGREAARDLFARSEEAEFFKEQIKNLMQSLLEYQQKTELDPYDLPELSDDPDEHDVEVGDVVPASEVVQELIRLATTLNPKDIDNFLGGMSSLVKLQLIDMVLGDGDLDLRANCIKYLESEQTRLRPPLVPDVKANVAPNVPDQGMINEALYVSDLKGFIAAKMRQCLEVEDGVMAYFKANPEFFASVTKLGKQLTKGAIEVFNDKGREMSATVVERAVNKLLSDNGLHPDGNNEVIRFTGSIKNITLSAPSQPELVPDAAASFFRRLLDRSELTSPLPAADDNPQFSWREKVRGGTAASPAPSRLIL